MFFPLAGMDGGAMGNERRGWDGEVYDTHWAFGWRKKVFFATGLR